MFYEYFLKGLCVRMYVYIYMYTHLYMYVCVGTFTFLVGVPNRIYADMLGGVLEGFCEDVFKLAAPF